MAYEILKILHQVSISVFILGMAGSYVFLWQHGAKPFDVRGPIFTKFCRVPWNIVNLAISGAWIFGIWMVVWHGFYLVAWWQAKIVFVMALSGMHGTLSKQLRLAAREVDYTFSAGKIVRPTVFLVLAIVVCYLALVKPF